MPDEMGLGSWW